MLQLCSPIVWPTIRTGNPAVLARFTQTSLGVNVILCLCEFIECIQPIQMQHYHDTIGIGPLKKSKF